MIGHRAADGGARGKQQHSSDHRHFCFLLIFLLLWLATTAPGSARAVSAGCQGRKPLGLRVCSLQTSRCNPQDCVGSHSGSHQVAILI